MKPSDGLLIYIFVSTHNWFWLFSQILGDEYTAEAGTYCNIYVQNVDLSYYKEWSENPVPLVVFSMLKHENKMSVMNVAVKKIFDPVNVGAIPSKERLIFHVGYRRFVLHLFDY